MSNLLASEPSAYLKSAAHQPVHWHPWGEAALERARVEDKPILLDIGAVWCHWCHVMDGESYEDPEVADLLNRDFVCVKVDRDERPDVDSRYQRAVQALTGQGGWPLTAFLTPEGEVFFGGTYFPPEDNRFGRPGFVSVLRQVAEAYRRDRDKVAKNAAAIRQHVTAGFHRYAVDERWIVPHFEKMSYDNSELLRAYLSAYQALGTDLYREVATGIVDWVLEVLADTKRGAFFTSQDADVAFGDDGDYWTWTPDEARAALDAAEFTVVRSVFDVEDAGEMDHNLRKNVLWRRREPATAEHVVLDAAIGKLKAARDRRRAPAVDTTAYVSWNAMMAGAFLHAGAVLDRRECNTLALAVLERIWNEAWRGQSGMAHGLGRDEPRGMPHDNGPGRAAFPRG